LSRCRVPGHAARVGDLANDTAVRSRGEGSYEATLSADWEIWGPMGGYVAACALRAAGASTEHARPASLSCHYLGVARFGPVNLRVETRRGGRTATSQRVEVTQEGRPILDAMVWSVGDVEGLEHDETSPPDVPDPDQLPDLRDLLPDDAEPPFPFWRISRGSRSRSRPNGHRTAPGRPGGRSGCALRRLRPSRTRGSTRPAV
jgi:acyl-CoA thioesterase II